MEKLIGTSSDGIVKGNNKLVSVHFESILEVLDYKCDNINESGWKDLVGKNAQDNFGGKSWLGSSNETSKDVIDHALAGDAELCRNLLDKIEQFRTQIGANRTDYVGPIIKTRRQRVYGDFGNEIDIHKVYQGNVGSAWSSMKRIELNIIQPLVSILIDIGGLSDVTVESSFWRAAVALHVSRELIAAGKSVKLTVGQSSSGAMIGDGRTLSTSIVIKDFNQQVSIERIAAMTHLGFFRTFNFAAKHVQNARVASGFGYTINLEQHVPLHLQEELDAGHTKFIYIGQITSQSGAETSLAKIYEQIGAYRNS